MSKYSTSGCHAVEADGMNEAAELFADRKARREFGRSGYARTCTINGYAQDGSFGEYNAFIGYRSGPGETTGHNVMFTVYREAQS